MTSKKILYIVVSLLIVGAVYMAYQGGIMPESGNPVSQGEIGDTENSDQDNSIDNSNGVVSRSEDAEETATDQITREFDYEDGEYEATADYTVPNGTQYSVQVAMSISDDVVTDVQVFFDDKESGQTSTGMQEAFYGAFGEEVIGQNLSEVNLSRVGGASLTSQAFNDAVVDIRAQAS